MTTTWIFLPSSCAKYHGEMDVERLIFNFPACSSWLLAPQVSILKERLHRCCPNARYLKCHTGQQFTLARGKVRYPFHP